MTLIRKKHTLLLKGPLTLEFIVGMDTTLGTTMLAHLAYFTP